jgi:uncharacterized protein YkwD
MRTTIKIILAGLLACASLAAFAESAAQTATETKAERLARYLALNDAETRLAALKDDERALSIKLDMIDYVNQSRARARLAPVELDILASRVANGQCSEAAKLGFTGHWNTAGLKPYMRWAKAGGIDHVSENAAATWSSGSLNPDQAYEYMRRSHDRFMAETPPADGHRQNVLRPEHNFVGLGFAFEGGQFRYYEEYIDRYLASAEYSREVAAGEKFTLSFRAAEGLWPYAVIAYYEPMPKPMTPAEISRKGAYADYSDSQAAGLWPNDLKIEDGGACSISLRFDRPGLYYVQIYLDAKDPRGATRFDTKGKIQASGIVIQAR